jgi:Protein of unknown function (DUF1579)
MKVSSGLFACSILLSPMIVFAQTQPSSMKKRFAEAAQAQSAPTAEHKALAPLVGDFDQQTEVRMGAGEPMKAHSIGHGQWIMDGRFVRVDSASAPDEELKGERLLVYGFDPSSKKYTLWGIETTSLTAFTAEGSYDPATKTFTFDGKRAQRGAGLVDFRWVIEVNDDSSLSQQILMKPPGSNDFVPVVTIQHTPMHH